MHPKRFARRPLMWGMIVVAGLIPTVSRGQQPMPIAAQPPAPLAVQPRAEPPPPEVKIDPQTGTLIVPLGGTVMWAPGLKELPTDFVVSQDFVELKSDPRDPLKYFLRGKTPGVSQVTFTFKNSPRVVFEVMVQPDLSLLRNIIKQTVPTAAIDVKPGFGNVIILSGYVTSPQDADTVARLASSVVGGQERNVINAIQVGGVQQVQIDVVVASVDRTMARTRGLDFSINGSTVNFQSIVSGLITSSTIGQSAAGTSPSLTISPAANLQVGIVPSNFFIALQALRTEGIAKFLAEPKVVTQSGRPAFFLAGGQQAILSGTSGITGPGVQLVPFGTQLDVLPIVYANGHIWLEINPKITAVSSALGITVGGAVSPGFTEQQVRSAVELESGQTYAIGGLIQNTMQTTSAKVPVLGDLPFLGVFFSTVTHSQTESELVILVTPRLVAPMNCDQVPKRLPGRETRNPDDYELFLENILEAPRGQRKVWNGRCYNAAYKCDPTAAIFPCVGGVCTGRPGAPLPCSTAPVVPGTMPGPAPLPSTLPPVQPVQPTGADSSGLPAIPGMPVGASGTQVEPLPGTYPAALPAVIIIPENPRN